MANSNNKSQNKRIKLGIIANEFFELSQRRMGGFGWATRQVTNYFNSNSNLGIDVVLIAGETYGKPGDDFKSRCYVQFSSLFKRYFEMFSPEQIRVYIYEDFNADSISVLQNILGFLDIDNTFIPDKLQKYNVTYIAKNQAINQLLNPRNSINSTLRKFFPSQLRRLIKTQLLKINNSQPPSLKPEIRKELVAEYREDILKLQDLIQKDLSHWLKV